MSSRSSFNSIHNYTSTDSNHHANTNTSNNKQRDNFLNVNKNSTSSDLLPHHHHQSSNSLNTIQNNQNNSQNGFQSNENGMFVLFFSIQYWNITKDTIAFVTTICIIFCKILQISILGSRHFEFKLNFFAKSIRELEKKKMNFQLIDDLK